MKSCPSKTHILQFITKSINFLPYVLELNQSHFYVEHNLPNYKIKIISNPNIKISAERNKFLIFISFLLIPLISTIFIISYSADIGVSVTTTFVFLLDLHSQELVFEKN